MSLCGVAANLQTPAYGLALASGQGSACASSSSQNALKASGQASDKNGLSADQLKQVQALKARDREVRTHEAAHQAAAGGLSQGGPSFTYQRGPDGNLYAIGGEVQIDVSPVSGDPEASIRKAETIKRAALAPASPSSQDRAVAASAEQLESAARQELLQKKRDSQNAARAYGPDDSTRKPQIDLAA
jgi:hypothetical protein